MAAPTGAGPLRDAIGAPRPKETVGLANKRGEFIEMQLGQIAVSESLVQDITERTAIYMSERSL